jgi:hypothetical protein
MPVHAAAAPRRRYLVGGAVGVAWGVSRAAAGVGFGSGARHGL